LFTVKLMTVEGLGIKSERNGDLMITVLVIVSQRAVASRPLGLESVQFVVLEFLTVN
jgi:hypothetical protein